MNLTLRRPSAINCEEANRLDSRTPGPFPAHQLTPSPGTSGTATGSEVGGGGAASADGAIGAEGAGGAGGGAAIGTLVPTDTGTLDGVMLGDGAASTARIG